MGRRRMVVSCRLFAGAQSRLRVIVVDESMYVQVPLTVDSRFGLCDVKGGACVAATTCAVTKVVAGLHCAASVASFVVSTG